jgi:hypothetical protein
MDSPSPWVRSSSLAWGEPEGPDLCDFPFHKKKKASVWNAESSMHFYWRPDFVVRRVRGLFGTHKHGFHF